MDKDVIYIEPEDDITDIITKIENSKEKIVALVPPKKAGILRSVVNIKLISKVGKTSKKTVVLVTTDPSILKLAASTKMPVTKDLETAPEVPTAEAEIAEEMTEAELVDDSAEEVEEAEAEEEAEEAEDEAEEEAEDDKPAKKPAKSAKKVKNPVIAWILAHKKISIFSGIGLLLLILFLIWAFVIAPAATLNVTIQTEPKSLVENVTFTKKAEDENVAEGKFYLQEKKVETVKEVEFKATGERNVGEKATGDVVVYASFRSRGSRVINEGATFSINGLTYTADKGTSLSWDGSNIDACDNKGQASLVITGCQVSGRIAVTATSAGSKYNIAASNSGWKTVADVGVYSDKAMSGGTDKVITVVEKSDIEKAKESIMSENDKEDSEDRQKLYGMIDDSLIPISSSYKQEISSSEATPAEGEEVKEGVTPKLKVTTTTSIYAIDKAKLEEFITAKAKINDDQKIYELKDSFVESFSESGDNFTGRLKASYAVGPKITDSEILEIVKGKGVGDAKHDLSNINGVFSVDIKTSYPWVSVIPKDTNKITINIDVKNDEKANDENKE